MLYFLSRYPTLQITVIGERLRLFANARYLPGTLSKQMVELIVAKLNQHVHGQPTLHMNAVNTRKSTSPLSLGIITHFKSRLSLISPGY